MNDIILICLSEYQLGPKGLGLGAKPRRTEPGDGVRHSGGLKSRRAPVPRRGEGMQVCPVTVICFCNETTEARPCPELAQGQRGSRDCSFIFVILMAFINIVIQY